MCVEWPRARLVMHHELDDVEQSTRLPARLVVAHPVKHRLELLPGNHAITVFIHLPNHVLHILSLDLVPQFFECLCELFGRDFRLLFLLIRAAWLLLREDLVDELQVLQLLGLVVLCAILCCL